MLCRKPKEQLKKDASTQTPNYEVISLLEKLELKPYCKFVSNSKTKFLKKK